MIKLLEEPKFEHRPEQNLPAISSYKLKTGISNSRKHFKLDLKFILTCWNRTAMAQQNQTPCCDGDRWERRKSRTCGHEFWYNQCKLKGQWEKPLHLMTEEEVSFPKDIRAFFVFQTNTLNKSDHDLVDQRTVGGSKLLMRAYRIMLISALLLNTSILQRRKR
jgi:hypothetical protein